jgi:membrane-bound inhibitor of C-type lysozyme
MNTNRILWIVLIVVLVIIAALGAWSYRSAGPAKVPAGAERSLTATAVYRCDGGKSIAAAYYEGPAAAQPAPGEAPTPTGSVDVSINGAATTTLAQTVSADGARYASADESLVFWNKGDTALIMRDNSMDLDYTNCTAGA